MKIIARIMALMASAGTTYFLPTYLEAGPARHNMTNNQIFKGQTITVLVLNGSNKGDISGPLHIWRKEWEEMTGAQLKIAEFPFAELHEKMFLDLITNVGNFDVFMICASEIGELVTGNYIIPIDPFYNDPRFPKWPKDAPPAIQHLHQWDGKWYGVLNDSDGQILYYRKDILTNRQYQDQFKTRYGYDLPVPPKSITQLHDISEFFNGWDWNRNGNNDSGISLPLKVGGQAAFHYLTFSAPFVVLPGDKVDNIHNTYWFDFETMKPLINEPGHVKALEYLIELVQTGPKAQAGWDVAEAWDYFLRGNAVFLFSWGDIGPLVQDPLRSRIKGKLGASIFPGAMEVYNRGQNRFVQLTEPNIIGNTVGCSWHGVISSLSKHPEAAYHLLAFHATERISQWNAQRGWTGVDIGRKNQLLTPWGPLNVEDYIKSGNWNSNDVVEYVTAYMECFNAKTIAPYLRIPGAVEYFNALDIHLSEAISGMISAKHAMDRAATDFEEITDRLGRDDQLKMYRKAMNYER